MAGAGTDRSSAGGSAAGRTAKADRSANRGQGRFFGLKQVLIFITMALLIIVIDAVILLSITLFEQVATERDTNSGATNVIMLASSLEKDKNGTWQATDELLLRDLDAAGCWAVLVDKDGKTPWSYNLPESFPTSFSRNDLAVIAHNRAWGTDMVYIWTKDDDLVMLGYPDGRYLFFGITLSEESFMRIPLYVISILLIDLLVIFLLYTLSQRSIVRSIGPILDSLDDLGEGRATHIRLSGTLRGVGERINRVSDTLLRKEAARKNWVAGVSHDTRTPLAVAMGHAERIEQNASLPQETRDTAAVITRQGIRIRDLIEDLNIATQLEYDMQPLNITQVPLPRLVRDVVVDYLNQNLEGAASLELEITDEAAQATLPGDERLLKRALRNAIDNALKHNAYDCTITVSLGRDSHATTLAVSDNGRGMAPGQLAELATTLERDYLGSGSLVALTETSATLADGRLMRGYSGSSLPWWDGVDAAGIGAAGISQVGVGVSEPAGGTPSDEATSASATTTPTNSTFSIGADPYAATPEPPRNAQSSTYPASMTVPVISGQKDSLGRRVPRTKHVPEPPVAYQGASQQAQSSANQTPRPAAMASSAGANGALGSVPRTGTIGQHGLGMPLIARIAIVHGGTFTIQSAEGHGFALIMRFPAANA